MSTPELPNRITSMLCLDDASYVLGSLSPADRQAYEQHLATCPICQASVSRLAGIPGLLALTSVDEVEAEAPPVPELLLPRLLAATGRQRRRRRQIWSGTVLAAAACIAALVVTLVLRPGPAATPSQAPSVAIAMQPLVPGPMDVSLQLQDKQWGTSVVVNCHYSGVNHTGYSYELVAYDKAGNQERLGGWKSVSGSVSTVTTATFLRLNEIAKLEVQETDGTALMSAVPRR